MFLRSTVVKSEDKKLRYWKLVENYATERGTRHRVKNVRRGRPGTRQAPWTPESGDELVPIYLGQVGWGNPRRFGDVYVALRFWKRLGLGNLLSKLRS